jgi:large conductance mechanosensitive channel
MPPIGLLVGNVNFSRLFLVLKAGKRAGPYVTPAAAKAASAVTLNYGIFINTIISFLTDIPLKEKMNLPTGKRIRPWSCF